MTVQQQLLEALIEASSMFDDRPELAAEYVGTYEVVHNAIKAGLSANG